MPETLLPVKPETTDSLLEDLEKLHAALADNANRIGQFLELMKGWAIEFENAWRKVIANVAKGKTAEMQAERMGLLNEFEKRLDILKTSYALLTGECKGISIDLDPDFLLSEIAGMERLKARVFDRWQSEEDLEDLAVRDYSLTTADLDKIGPQRRPPDSWYAEESKPF